MLEQLSFSFLELTAEAANVASEGSPEFIVYSAVPAGDDGAEMAALEASLGKPTVKLGMGAAMKSKWLQKDGTKLKRARDDVSDVVRDQLLAIRAVSRQVARRARSILSDGDEGRRGGPGAVRSRRGPHLNTFLGRGGWGGAGWSVLDELASDERFHRAHNGAFVS